MSAVVTDDLTAVDVMLSGPTDGGSASQVRRACPTTTTFPCLPHPHPSHFWACEPEPHRTLAYGPDVPRPDPTALLLAPRPGLPTLPCGCPWRTRRLGQG